MDTQQPTGMRCPYCGAPLPQGAPRCPRCGAPVKQ